MEAACILSFDHGTTGIKACLYDKEASLISRAYQAFPQIYPQDGWVEHDANILWNLTLPLAEEALKKTSLQWQDIHAIGITNQRETTIVWDKESGNPLYNAIVWQCRRTMEICEKLKREGVEELFKKKTGLLLDPYFSGTKLYWLLKNLPEAQKILAKGRLLFGTVDSWIIWNLTGRKKHLTDPTNASRTLLYDIHKKEWDQQLLKILEIPLEILPTVEPSSVVEAFTDPQLTGGCAIPIRGVAGDQQAALYGQLCWEKGSAKTTYGTGAFVMMNSAEEGSLSEEGLLTTLACDALGQPCYATEGSLFIAGAALGWLEKGLGIIESPKEADKLAGELKDNEGVYFVPAFVGLGAPYWDAKARAAIYGLTQDSGPEHIARAAFEAMAYQTKEVLAIMQKERGVVIEELRVDGGVTRSDFFLKFLADTLALPVRRSEDPDITAKGAAFLAGIGSHFWDSAGELLKLEKESAIQSPKMDEKKREKNFSGWEQAVERTVISSR